MKPFFKSKAELLALESGHPDYILLYYDNSENLDKAEKDLSSYRMTPSVFQLRKFNAL